MLLQEGRELIRRYIRTQQKHQRYPPTKQDRRCCGPKSSVSRDQSTWLSQNLNSCVAVVCDERVPTPIVPTVHQDAVQARVRRDHTTVGRRGEHAVHRAIDSSVAGGRSAGGGEGRSASARSAHAPAPRLRE